MEPSVALSLGKKHDMHVFSFAGLIRSRTTFRFSESPALAQLLRAVDR
jgi:hypothetical protein